MEDPVGCADSAVDGVADVLDGADDLENQLATGNMMADGCIFGRNTREGLAGRICTRKGAQR
jgi:hypothetical protein